MSLPSRDAVTIPAEVRRLLGAKPRNKIAFRVEGDTVRLVPVELTLEQIFGSVTHLQRPEDFDERSWAAKEEKVQRTLEEPHM